MAIGNTPVSESNARQLERLALHRTLNLAAADALCARSPAAHFTVDDNLNPLQVRLKCPARDAGDLATDAAQVLCLAASSDLMAERRLLSTKITLHAHDRTSEIWLKS
jgi:hypothetical protein